MAYMSINRTFQPQGGFCCYTEVLQSEVFISKAVGDVMTGVDGLSGK